MTANIYDQHDKHFAQVSAFVVFDGENRVATVALKFPADGAGRLYAYVHWCGLPMVRGFAGGGGYDKRTAGVASAVGRMPDMAGTKYDDGTPHHTEIERQRYDAFRRALAADNGSDWQRQLSDIGFRVFQAV